MADIFSEVDEDLRREKLEKLWKKTAPLIFGGVVLFIGAMAGRLWWVDYQMHQRTSESEQYQAAVASLEAGRQEAALQELENLKANAEHGYDLLSALQAASVMVSSGRVDEGLAAYDAIAANSGYEKRYRDYAALMAAMVVLDQARYGEARDRLAPLIDEGGFWSFSARELSGLMALETGDWETANEIFTDLNIDQNAPQELRARAGEFLQILDVKRPQSQINQSEPLAGDGETVAQEVDPESPDQ